MTIVEIARNAVELLSGENAVIAILVFTIIGLGWHIRNLNNQHDKAREDSHRRFLELQDKMTELQSDFSESNLQNADRNIKVSQTLESVGKIMVDLASSFKK